MKLLLHKRSRNAEQLSLFDWADRRTRDHFAIPLAARVLSRKFGISPRRAALIAELAGFGERA
jgi:hypothetical protein